MIGTDLVLDLADAIDERYRVLVLVAGFAGLRKGECLGLRRSDFDELHAELRVERQAQEVGGRIVVPPKSEAGRRRVVVPSLLVDALTEHLAAHTAPDADAPIFTSPEGGPLGRATLSDAWRAALRAVDAPVGLRIHDLRHHALTLAARSLGVTTKELMARAGHASPRALLIYQHATAERDRIIAGHLDAVIGATVRAPRAKIVGLADSARGAGVGLASEPRNRRTADLIP
jgi:integrase